MNEFWFCFVPLFVAVDSIGVLVRFLDITVSDFMIAGGILLLAISLRDLITGEKNNAKQIRKVSKVVKFWEVDPLERPRCHADMKLSASLTRQ
jgi:small neutral amino acid transporter SnatA (MarC family)